MRQYNFRAFVNTYARDVEEALMLAQEFCHRTEMGGGTFAFLIADEPDEVEEDDGR